MDITWQQIIALGIFLVVGCFLGWCFFRYGQDTTTTYYNCQDDETKDKGEE